MFEIPEISNCGPIAQILLWGLMVVGVTLGTVTTVLFRALQEARITHALRLEALIDQAQRQLGGQQQ